MGQTLADIRAPPSFRCPVRTALPDVVLPKIAQKRQSNCRDLAIFVKSTSGSTEIRNFRFFGVFEQFLGKKCSKTPKNWKLWISVLPDVEFTKIAKS